jgi:hypothetical protein
MTVWRNYRWANGLLHGSLPTHPAQTLTDLLHGRVGCRNGLAAVDTVILEERFVNPALRKIETR